MPSPLIDSEFFDQIRAALGRYIDADMLPDNIISMPIYLDAGIYEVLQRDPLAESRTGAELTRVQNAAVLFTAYFLTFIDTRVNSEKEGDITLTYDNTSLEKLAEMLRLRAMSEIDSVIGMMSLRPTTFTLAQGRRGL